MEGIEHLYPIFMEMFKPLKMVQQLPLQGLTVGRGDSETNQCWNGYVSEVIIYSSVLTNTQRQ